MDYFVGANSKSFGPITQTIKLTQKPIHAELKIVSDIQNFALTSLGRLNFGAHYPEPPLISS